MKKSIFIGLFILGVCSYSQAQSLIFKQVLLLGTSSNSNVTLGTVPSGKVWKITASGSDATSYYSCGISFNGSNPAFRLGNTDKYGSSYTNKTSHENIWLPAGTTITALSCSYYRSVSIIEFEIGP